MKGSVRWILIGVLMVVVAGFPSPGHAQFGKLKKKAQKKIERKADKKVDEAMDDALDEAEDQIEGGAEDATSSDPNSDTNAESSGSSSESTAKTSATKSSGLERVKPGEGAWANYDFIPGDRVLYYEDMERTPVGDFPQRLDFEKGNMEVVEWEGSNYLRLRSHCDLNIPLPEILPERFTFEFDLYLPEGQIEIYCPTDKSKREHTKHSYIEITKHNVQVRGSGGGESQMKIEKELRGEVVRCRVMGYKKYLKVYFNEIRMANIPNADFVRGDKIHFYLYNPGAAEVLMDNFRIAEGGKKILYDALLADGRVATRGIYFDSGSDGLRPESTPTLKQMGEMLQEHSDLRLLIEGHTDDQGDNASNQDLSERRAASVRSYLVSEYGIDGGRLESKGFGETKPVSPNGTPEGRQNNRRVELVKL
jgi:outer membrane protein OmpA-like peptidoglycan-associated protein